MPKGKVMIPGSRKSKTLKRKFKLGGRKNTMGAHTLNNVQLLERFENESHKRDRNKIQQVLQARGVMVAGKNAFELVAESASE